MSFFDSKQETINIELTSYGKLLLSKGKFKPVYYAFFDDDVVYDSNYIEISESQNDIQQRIMNETPTLKPQSIFTGADLTVIKNTDLYNEYSKESGSLQETQLLRLVEQQVSSDKNYALSLPIGKSSFNSEYYPAWHINMISGTITSSAQYIDNSDGFSGSLQPYLKIPQINLKDIVEDVIKVKNTPFMISKDGYENIGFIIDGNGDAINIDMKVDQYLLEVLEKNVDDVKENFDIEVFIDTDGQKKNWQQLSFVKEPVVIKDNILLDSPEIAKDADQLYKNPNFVEHYFKILVDDEIILPPKQKISVATYTSTVAPDVTGDNC